MQNPTHSPPPAERPERPRRDDSDGGAASHTAAHRDRAPGEDPGTLSDEDYLSAGGPESIDSATSED